MSRIRIYHESQPHIVLAESSDHAEIAEWLHRDGVRFERWTAKAPVLPGATPEQVADAYRDDIDRILTDPKYQAFDVISIASDHPQKDALRRKFLDEHRHGEDEVRFFVAGAGLFTIHLDTRVIEVLCEQGDLICVPEQTRHWFDMGPNPNFIAIRIFGNPLGWIAQFTGDDIAQRFPRFEP